MPDLFQYSFVVRAFIAGGIIGFISPLLGTFLVLRRLSLIADTLAHVALAGAVVGLLLDKSPIFIAVGVSAVAAVALEYLRAKRRLEGDSALALLLYSALAVTVVLVNLRGGFNADLFGFLFGSVITVGRTDVWATAGLGVVVLLTTWVFYTELVQSTFDPELARVSGIHVGRTNLVLAILTAVTVTLSMRVVGALLVGALIVFPVLASLQLRQSFRATLLVASIIGMVSVFTGLTISYYQNIATGGAIVLVALGFLLLTSAVRKLTAGRITVDASGAVN